MKRLKKVYPERSRRGFTLIELLIVMAIIGILAALSLTGFSAARKTARDTQRKSDLAQYKTALEGYAANHSGVYPDATNDCDGGSCTGNSHATSGIFVSGATYPIIPNYLPTKIDDPATSATYTYQYLPDVTGSVYVLWAKLETGSYWELCSIGKTGLVAALPADTVCDVLP